MTRGAEAEPVAGGTPEGVRKTRAESICPFVSRYSWIRWARLAARSAKAESPGTIVARTCARISSGVRTAVAVLAVAADEVDFADEAGCFPAARSEGGGSMKRRRKVRTRRLCVSGFAFRVSRSGAGVAPAADPACSGIAGAEACATDGAVAGGQRSAWSSAR